MSHQHDVYSANLSASDGMENGQLCLICNDKATGKHYGAYSCDGCKGFFRRSVRKKNNYTCQYNKNCKMDKDKRNQCRYCRLKKCILVGMKRTAVQNERDRISTRRSSFDDVPPNVLLSIPQLLQAEQRIVVQNSKVVNPQELLHRLADVDDVCESMKSQLYNLVNWAKSLPCFAQLNLNDQISLLKTHAGEILILGVIRRSFQLEDDDVLLLGNNLVISRNSGDQHFAEIACHILDDLFIPLRELQLDEAEFACLKAIVFFDPTVIGLAESSKEFIRRCRYQIQMDLMNHMNDKQYHKPGRFGELLLMIPDLRHVAQLMVKKVEFMKMTGLANIDSLLSETLLGDNSILLDFAQGADNNNNTANGYNPTNSAMQNCNVNNYDPISLIGSQGLPSSHITAGHNIYGLPAFVPNQILLDINNQNMSQEATSSIWRNCLPNSSAMNHDNIYTTFVSQDSESIQPNSHGSQLCNMIINSDGMILKRDSIGVPSLFSNVNDTLNLYQHSTNPSHNASHFLVNLDQSFPMIAQQHSSKFNSDVGREENCASSSSDEILPPVQSASDSRSVDPTPIMTAYTKSISDLPIKNCQIQSISHSQVTENVIHPKMSYSSSSVGHFMSDQKAHSDSRRTIYKTEEY